jgi:hypothetical protein
MQRRVLLSDVVTCVVVDASLLGSLCDSDHGSDDSFHGVHGS